LGPLHSWKAQREERPVPSNPRSHPFPLRFQFHPAVANLSKKDQMKAPRGPPRPAWLLAHSSREVRRASILLFSKREMKNHPPIMQQILLCS
jgi:hypothetical protein